MTRPPVTKGLKAQKLESLNPMEQWWNRCLDDREFKIFGFSENAYTYDLYKENPTKQFIHQSYLSWIDENKPNQKERITCGRAFGRAFIKLVGKEFLDPEQKGLDKKTNKHVNAYKFRNVDNMINKFNSLYE